MTNQSLDVLNYEAPKCESFAIHDTAVLCGSGTVKNPVFDPEEEFEM